MNEQELIRKLNSVGKTIFVKYFQEFRSYSVGKISREECVEILVKNRVSNNSGAAIRCGNAKRIFDEKMECDALKIVSGSNKLPSEVSIDAQKILHEIVVDFS